MTTTFVTDQQKKHLEIALKLTNSRGFMDDAVALAAYRPGREGEAEQIVSVAVFECIRGGQAELHFGTTDGRPMSLEMVQGAVAMAFHARLLNLSRVVTKTPIWHTNAICALLKCGFQIEHRERNCLADGGDAIVSSLDRAAIRAHSATAAPQPQQPPSGE